MPPDISLVVGTLDRRNELARLLDSLIGQPEVRFDVILVDQNPPGFLDEVLKKYSALPITHVRAPPGLSRARNVGLACARGTVVGFPDDDCWYDPGVLRDVHGRFVRTSRLDVLTGVSRDELGFQSAGRFDACPGPITKDNVWRRGNSATLFIRRTVAGALHGFDESLGIGAFTPWQSGEETDLLLRAIHNGFVARFDPTLVVRHPQVPERTPSRAVAYGRGHMKVLQMHGYPFRFKLKAVLTPLVGSAIYAACGRSAKAWVSLWTAVGRFDTLARHIRARYSSHAS